MAVFGAFKVLPEFEKNLTSRFYYIPDIMDTNNEINILMKYYSHLGHFRNSQ